ncbi:MAG: TetR/AcrR family transcriptional regulator [Campylobacterales bacterium]|nr:TetR/AcrR family transcriptional regulator [Campylobacterales bacterium]
MARTSSISKEMLVTSLAVVFRRHGYEGASMAELSKETGLQKASLYHRFPGGKEEMANAVLDYVNNVVEENIVKPLDNPEITPSEKTAILIKNLEIIYNGGNNSCLYNVLSYPVSEKSPFADTIKRAFNTLSTTISKLLQEYGVDVESADAKASTILMLLQGSLVLCRGTDSTKPFEDAIQQIKNMITMVQAS